MARKSSQTTQSLPSMPSNGPQDEARKAVLEKALNDIVKRYGEGSIMRMGEAHHMEVEAIPTGSLSLDIALGIGGIPRGRITEIYGPESSGKTTICQHIVAETQRMGGMAAYIDGLGGGPPGGIPCGAASSCAVRFISARRSCSASRASSISFFFESSTISSIRATYSFTRAIFSSLGAAGLEADGAWAPVEQPVMSSARPAATAAPRNRDERMWTPSSNGAPCPSVMPLVRSSSIR